MTTYNKCTICSRAIIESHYGICGVCHADKELEISNKLDVGSVIEEHGKSEELYMDDTTIIDKISLKKNDECCMTTKIISGRYGVYKYRLGVALDGSIDVSISPVDAGKSSFYTIRAIDLLEAALKAYMRDNG